MLCGFLVIIDAIWWCDVHIAPWRDPRPFSIFFFLSFLCFDCRFNLCVCVCALKLSKRHFSLNFCFCFFFSFNFLFFTCLALALCVLHLLCFIIIISGTSNKVVFSSRSEKASGIRITFFLPFFFFAAVCLVFHAFTISTHIYIYIYIYIYISLLTFFFFGGGTCRFSCFFFFCRLFPVTAIPVQAKSGKQDS